MCLYMCYIYVYFISRLRNGIVFAVSNCKSLEKHLENREYLFETDPDDKLT